MRRPPTPFRAARARCGDRGGRLRLGQHAVGAACARGGRRRGATGGDPRGHRRGRAGRAARRRRRAVGGRGAHGPRPVGAGPPMGRRRTSAARPVPRRPAAARRVRRGRRSRARADRRPLPRIPLAWRTAARARCRTSAGTRSAPRTGAFDAYFVHGYWLDADRSSGRRLDRCRRIPLPVAASRRLADRHPVPPREERAHRTRPAGRLRGRARSMRDARGPPRGADLRHRPARRRRRAAGAGRLRPPHRRRCGPGRRSRAASSPPAAGGSTSSTWPERGRVVRCSSTLLGGDRCGGPRRGARRGRRGRRRPAIAGRRRRAAGARRRRRCSARRPSRIRPSFACLRRRASRPDRRAASTCATGGRRSTAGCGPARRTRSSLARRLLDDGASRLIVTDTEPRRHARRPEPRAAGPSFVRRSPTRSWWPPVASARSTTCARSSARSAATVPSSAWRS